MPENNIANQEPGGFRPAPELTVSFLTLGCKVNRYESDAVRQAFEARGFRVLADGEAADVVVINTCTVTAEADRKSRQMIRRAKRRNPDALVVAMGCQVELMKSASDADIAIGTKDRISIVDMAASRFGLPDPVTDNRPENAEDPAFFGKERGGMAAAAEGESEGKASLYQEFGSVLSQEDTRAYIKIEDGCNSFCSYCIIPYARGRVVSRKPEDVIREAEALAAGGFREVVLTGIHICSFGRDRGEGIEALSGLLDELEKIPGICRIRLGSLEPNSLTEEFIRHIAGLRKICPHFHISLQSGSDGVLSRMNRKYDGEGYRRCISLFRQYFPGVAITTDVIVGFPAETDEEHIESLCFCREMAFSRIHVFPFSERKGTLASGMMPKIPPDKKIERRDDFLKLSEEMSAEYGKSFIGKTVDVLLETENPDGSFSGYTRHYIRVNVSPDEGLSQGNEIKIRLRGFYGGEAYGDIASN